LTERALLTNIAATLFLLTLFNSKKEMNIDHIFIFTEDHGKVADKLVEFGLTEGSNRVHAGQGTTNRKFYFENFFLEILWVHNQTEIESELTKPTGLWQRADFKSNNFFVPSGSQT
jgi:Glyoxalase-like domain